MDKEMLDNELPTPSAIFNYREQTKVLVSRCPACGDADQTRLRFLPDRYGFNVILISCPTCKLNYLSEQLTRAGYDAFYAGPYRQLVWLLRGKGTAYDAARDRKSLIANQRLYSYQLGNWLEGRGVPKGLRVLDAGGSTGEVVREVNRTLAFASMMVLDPAVQELPLTDSIKGYLEDPIAGQYDLVLCCETLDHVTKPAACLKNIRKALAPGGYFYVDVNNKQTWGVSDSTIKIDHPLYWTTKALDTALRAAGFTVLNLSEFKWLKTWKTRALCQVC